MITRCAQCHWEFRAGPHIQHVAEIAAGDGAHVEVKPHPCDETYCDEHPRTE